MTSNGAAFTDHYEVLECSPDTSSADLKKAYHEKLRQYHPDKRPTSSTGVGCRVTAALFGAWEELQDTEKRAAYDELWHRSRQPTSPAELAEVRRREGNALYQEAQSVTKQASTESLSAAAFALHKYQAAIDKYSEGVQLAPQDHRIRSNRALCYCSLKDWTRCRDDSMVVIQLKPDFMKGWFLLAKALWKDGQSGQALRELEAGLRLVPGNAELLALQAEIAPQGQEAGVQLPKLNASRSRNVSPVCTPTQGNSRVATPPPIGRGGSKSPAPAARQRASSRSPAPVGQQRSHDETANFGDPNDRTAIFGHQQAGSRSGRSASPAPVYHDQTFGAAETSFGPQAPYPPAAPGAPG
ncbi:unnamed protein product, partial [Polarella glacialis]